MGQTHPPVVLITFRKNPSHHVAIVATMQGHDHPSRHPGRRIRLQGQVLDTAWNPAPSQKSWARRCSLFENPQFTASFKEQVGACNKLTPLTP